MEKKKEFKSLGAKKTVYNFKYNCDLLERFENENKENDYFVTLDAYEFTTLCPITGQPDFASIYISYVPDDYLVESKSLKLYLFSFRNNAGFHEDTINIILKDLIKLLNPKYLEVFGIFAPRGGIAIYPFANFAKKGCGYEEFKKTRGFENLNNIVLGHRNYRN